MQIVVNAIYWSLMSDLFMKILYLWWSIFAKEKTSHILFVFEVLRYEQIYNYNLD